ncbi:hypothetical protein [Paralysiella testudinis]|uniref:Uncharacterized protein n=1 Tax=Paralysiella testudinis TaxID=2809020 RepID=A0A892ZD27_9NEIS|nr:hypothetical protein [Paralysiella testudinis]QRQ80842.1 hypothetical protein JQU52_08765 [Paralysiella testudinis]
MQKWFILPLLTMASASAFAWHFYSIDLDDRSFEVINRHGGNVQVADVKCTRTDGSDSLYVAGYFSPTGRWNYAGKSYANAQVRQVPRDFDDVLPAYMKFCAMVNKRGY